MTTVAPTSAPAEKHDPLTPEDRRRIAVLNAVTDAIRSRQIFGSGPAEASDVVHVANWVLGTFDPWAPDTTAAKPEPILSPQEFASLRKPPAADAPPREWVAGDIVRLSKPSENGEVAAVGEEDWQVTPLPSSSQVLSPTGKLRLRHPDLPWSIHRLPDEVTLTGHIAGGAR